MTDMDKIIITEINFREAYNFIFDDQEIRELYQMCPYDVEYNDFYDSMKYNCIKTLFVPDGFEIIKFIPSNVGTLVLNNDIKKIDAKIGLSTKIVFKNVNQFLNVYPNIKYIYIDEYDIKQKMCYPVMIEIEDSTFQLMNSTIRHNTEINLIINNLNHEIVEFIKLFLINNEFRQM